MGALLAVPEHSLPSSHRCHRTFPHRAAVTLTLRLVQRHGPSLDSDNYIAVRVLDVKGSGPLKHLLALFEHEQSLLVAAQLRHIDQTSEARSPGERLFLPEFGGGVRKLVFEPASDVLRGVVKARITNGLSRWLGHRLTVELIDVVFDDAVAMLEVTVKYRPAGAPDSRVVKFQRTGS